MNIRSYLSFLPDGLSLSVKTAKEAERKGHFDFFAAAAALSFFAYD